MHTFPDIEFDDKLLTPFQENNLMLGLGHPIKFCKENRKEEFPHNSVHRMVIGHLILVDEIHREMATRRQQSTVNSRQKIDAPKN